MRLNNFNKKKWETKASKNLSNIFSILKFYYIDKNKNVNITPKIKSPYPVLMAYSFYWLYMFYWFSPTLVFSFNSICLDYIFLTWFLLWWLSHFLLSPFLFSPFSDIPTTGSPFYWFPLYWFYFCYFFLLLSGFKNFTYFTGFHVLLVFLFFVSLLSVFIFYWIFFLKGFTLLWFPRFLVFHFLVFPYIGFPI